MSQTLRSYQREAVDAVFGALGDGLTRVLYTLPTGAGKTTVFAEIVRRALLLDSDARVLILAHRRELIGQAYNRVKEHCGLSTFDIGMEIATERAHGNSRVIVGSVQTCMRRGRPAEGWTPTLIITDEGHHSAAKRAYGSIYERYGVVDGRCAHVGCTATAKRTDRQSLYALDVSGAPVLIEDKHAKGRKREASAEDSVFEKHVYDFTVADAIDDGWLVPVHGHTIATDTDINAVETDRDGDFKEGQLAAAVDTARRTMQAIAAWRMVAADRPTLVFCASVEHAHHAAALWEQAGYTAAAVDGATDTYTRGRAFEDFKAGRLQVLCNMGIATEGTDLPNCGCIVHMRPTKSWSLYLQMSGRGLRVLPGVLDRLQDETADKRLRAIEASAKPNCIILDLVDLYAKCGELCSVPSILDLPVKLDLEGHSLTEAKKLLDEFEQVREAVIGECPVTFTDLKVRLEAVDLMRRSGASSVQAWRATDEGYRFVQVPPGYRCDMAVDGETYRLVVAGPNGAGVLLDRTGKPGKDIRAYLDYAAKHAQAAIDAHRASLPKPSLGTAAKLGAMGTGGLLRALHANGHRDAEIDTWPLHYARHKAVEYVQSWQARRKSREEVAA